MRATVSFAVVVGIGSNISSLQVQRQLHRAVSNTNTSLERLSSGLRINHPSDDAAGLAIASSLSSNSRVFSQGVRNLNDGLSLLNIAGDAIGQMSSIVIRIRELATQASNGSFSFQQRGVLNTEANSLISEFNRIAQSTSFNGRRLIDASLSSLRIQSGYGLDGSIGFSVADKLARGVGTGTFREGNTLNSSANVSSSITSADFNGDGKVDLAAINYLGDAVGIMLGNGDGTFSAEVSYAAGATPRSLRAADFNGDGVTDLALIAGGDVAVLRGLGNGTFGAAVVSYGGAAEVDIQTGDFNGDGKIDLGVINNSGKGANLNIGLMLGNGNFTFQSATSIDLGSPSYQSEVQVGDMNHDGIDDLLAFGTNIRIFYGATSGSFQSQSTANISGDSYFVKTGDFNGDGLIDIARSPTAALNTVQVFLANQDGTFNSGTTLSSSNATLSLSTADFNGDGILDLLAMDGQNSIFNVFLGNGDGSFKARMSKVASANLGYVPTFGDFDGDGALDIASTKGLSSGILLFFADATRVTTLGRVDLTSQANARGTIQTMSAVLDRIALETGQIGASQSRLQTALAHLQNSQLEYKQAESRIIDVDVATEAAHMTRNQIAVQIGTAILAQANQSPELALSLLKNL